MVTVSMCLIILISGQLYDYKNKKTFLTTYSRKYFSRQNYYYSRYKPTVPKVSILYYSDTNYDYNTCYYIMYN